MATLSPAQIYALARNAGLSAAAATTATAIALAESGGRTDAQGDIGLQDSKWGPSIGLWQVRSVKAEYGTGGTRDASRLADPAFNAKSMVAISGGGVNWRPWSVYLHGTYQKFMSQVASSATFAGASATGTATPDGGGLGGILGPGFGGLIDVPPAPGPQILSNALGSLTTDWGKDAMTIGLKILAGAAAAGLVIAGAIHTVK